MNVARADGLCQVVEAFVCNFVPRQVEFLEPLGLLYVLADLVDLCVTDASSIEIEDSIVNFLAKGRTNG